MSFKPLALALADALVEDLQPFAAFSMATMAEYGRVGDYAPAYLEVKLDVLDFLTLCEALRIETPLNALQSLPPLAPNRLIKESFFEEERDALIAAAAAAGNAIQAAPEEALEARFDRLEPERREAFNVLLDRSGLDVEAVRRSPLAGAARDKIYVSSRYSPRLRDQISSVVAEVGLDPIGASDVSGSLNLARVERDIAECIGGVFGLSQPNAEPSFSAASEPLSAGLAELALAERRMGRKLMILAQEGLVRRLPTRLRTRPIFRLRDRVMDDQELVQFKSVAAKTPWLLQ